MESLRQCTEKTRVLGLRQPPHCLSYTTVLEQLSSDADDPLTSLEAHSRLDIYGQIRLEEGEGISIGKILLRQIANAMMLVSILAMAVSFGIQSWIEGGVIAGIIGLNIVVGFFREYAAEKTMASLRSLTTPSGTVSRDGHTVIIPAIEIVPGDIVDVKTGEIIPADLIISSRLIEVLNFETNEALLTGEPLPVQKDAEATFEEDIGPGDRLNIAYSSSTVTRGKARGIAIATGMDTEIGKIAPALRASERKRRPVKTGPSWTLTITDTTGRFLGLNVGTSLQKKLSRLAVVLFGIAVIFAIVVILYAVATGLSMIPACLVVVLTITMAVGTKRMVQRHVIVRKLSSLEALGAIANICSDKTGTLTQGKMIVKKAWVASRGTFTVEGASDPFNPTLGETRTKRPNELLTDNKELKEYLDKKHEGDEVEENSGWHARGEPTEIAIQVFASRFSWDRDRLTKSEDAKRSQKLEFPFDSDIKRMAVVYKNKAERKLVAFSKGAVERILERCSEIVVEQNSPPSTLDDEHREWIMDNMEALTKMDLRVLALAKRDAVPDTEGQAQVEADLCFLGLVGIYDPPRPESARAVEICHHAGISVHMLTGDHPGTAEEIARQVGILPNFQQVAGDVAGAMIFTGNRFDRLSDEEVDALPLLPRVIARCAPQTKVKMINAFHRRGSFVAMTGDGVDDTPSLKIADVGIAMGLTGSDVAKDASDIVLTDDNFASILNAIEKGRRIFDNIQRFVLHLLSENVAQACTLLVGLAFKDEIEILWIIMITSGLPDMGLGMEIATLDIMDRPPQSKKGIFTWEVVVDIVVYGTWMAALCLSSFSLVIWGFGDGDLGLNCNRDSNPQCKPVFRARATTFVSLTWFALFLAWEMVDMRRSFFRMHSERKRYLTQWIIDVWRNKFWFWAIIAGFVLVFPVLYIPVIDHDVFKHSGISWEWGIVGVEIVLFFAGVESWKWAKRMFFRGIRRNHQEGSAEIV
ncbi:potassium/sodium eff [Aspergillus homomorphus CBS 101889]|uniref:P-type Na(+) transporter n=1 Tax=Aspergillus homomorphus (strain CBS 101889) TaxID=1450537 RepID=A0A395I030_ASPHC|nr:potassium/sodium eff [Aspergillus homomorphus CBS 101889]RAL13095.1 potassium/sodium eff [Aspergillus homomorphus CBS 101889]